jgi:Na+-translocating ferredoxin:NAD+ oxidoreductase RNF subunit RnfB
MTNPLLQASVVHLAASLTFEADQDAPLFDALQSITAQIRCAQCGADGTAAAGEHKIFVTTKEQWLASPNKCKALAK